MEIGHLSDSIIVRYFVLNSALGHPLGLELRRDVRRWVEVQNADETRRDDSVGSLLSCLVFICLCTVTVVSFVFWLCRW